MRTWIPPSSFVLVGYSLRRRAMVAGALNHLAHLDITKEVTDRDEPAESSSSAPT
jgi:hypothetical protein